MFHELDSLCPADRDLFHHFGHGLRVEPRFSLVHQAFEDVVDTRPSLVAAEHDGNTVTYHELERLSNVLANNLIQSGLEPRQRVCLVLQRSIDMVVAILAVIKCGCQYVPLDGGVVPDNVMSHIFEDTQAQFVLCLAKFHHKVQHCAGSTTTIVVLDAPREEKRCPISTERPAANTIIATPSVLRKLVRAEYPNIQVVALAGEPCPKSLADEWATEATLYHCCGPTEVTIVNTMHVHQPGHDLSIGQPVPNTDVYILDENEKPLPIGSIGLMWAGGRCVSRGYLNLPEETSKKFKLNKFVSDGSFMFNTGDLGRWRDDGTLETLGRIDDQVKIKGFRVELSSVATAIEQTPGINRACAILNDEVLWGFYSGPSYVDEFDVKAVVSKCQPYYAIPSQWVYRLDLPLTPNGKIDKQALLASIPVNQEMQLIANPTPAILNDPDKYPAVTAIESSDTGANKSDSSTSSMQEKHPLPQKFGTHGARALRYRFFSLYRRFFSVVFIGNMVAVIYMIHRYAVQRPGLPSLGTATAANLCTAVLMRQDHVVNILFTLACSVPTSAPLFIRRNCAKVYHIGGLHSGAGVAATAWLLVFTIAATIEFAHPAVLAVSYTLIALLVGIVASAHPTFRARFHNRFELIHRFAGWTALALFWIQTIVLTDSLRGTTPLGKALTNSPRFWLLLIATSSVALPWLNLRKVNVRRDVLSGHAVRLYFDYATPVVGTAVRISQRPLVEWHAFATIAKPNEKGFSLLASNAGDWTLNQIQNGPPKLWVRGVPACGVLRIAPLFRRIVLVATGSGIGPCLPVIYAKRVPARIFWSTPHPEQNFGPEIIKAVYDADPDAVIHNTKTMGRPDMIAISYRLLQESNAEAVCVISNKKLTQMIVYGMESRGIPAFGAIFDS
ncbi:hypothetical protein VC83_05144 [Pseudogymnoascus destructans]|uniref:AMP-dependent synthetase/ligase domain-containing protein n=1 Tax=Pseudogymnoascus destructans TaxID=655981 RepID=A0A177AAD1_9PEZI|nr:uncharacterized protein VC83_05144 [Pseudogymnoascus destructans]OAF58720.1 hypothetical protein VC83_05144 [Pseudogymnoascus destructans]